MMQLSSVISPSKYIVLYLFVTVFLVVIEPVRKVSRMVSSDLNDV